MTKATEDLIGIGLAVALIGGIYWGGGSPAFSAEAEAEAVYALGRTDSAARSWAVSKLAGLQQVATKAGNTAAAAKIGALASALKTA